MNKYYVKIGEITLERICEEFIVYTKNSKEKLEENEEFLILVDDVISDMYYNYMEDGEDWEDFRDSMGIIEIEDWKDEYKDYTTNILYDER